MSDNPYKSPQKSDELPARKPGTLRRTIVSLVVGFGILGLLIALLLPARRNVRGAARRTQCANNLKQIALALLNYEADYHALPPACTVDAEGNPLHSWRTLILPYLEQQALYDKIDLSKPWDDPANKEAFEANIPEYKCPSVALADYHTTYLAVVVPGGCFRPTEPRKLSEITDAKNLTLMVVEVDAEHGVHWMSPADAGEAWTLDLESSLEQPHRTGFQAACVDGSVHFFRADTKTELLRALISIAGDDDAVAQEFD